MSVEHEGKVHDFSSDVRGKICTILFGAVRPCMTLLDSPAGLLYPSQALFGTFLFAPEPDSQQPISKVKETEMWDI